MNRREFIKYSAIAGIISAYPTVALSDTRIVIKPSGSDDTNSINAALRASARIGDPVFLDHGLFNVTNTIVVPIGAQLIGQGRLSTVSFDGRKIGEVIRIEEPHVYGSVKRLYVEDSYSPVPFAAIIG